MFGACLDMVTDRSSTTMLLLQLSILYPEYVFWFQLLAGLDLSSHYMHIVSTNKQGKQSHKEIDNNSPYLMKLYYENRIFLFICCGGNEMFFLLLLACKVWDFMELKYLLVGVFPIFLFKQLMNLIQLVNASNQLVQQDLIIINAKNSGGIKSPSPPKVDAKDDSNSSPKRASVDTRDGTRQLRSRNK